MASFSDHLICCYLIICEKVLSERDGVLSPIRLVDVFFTKSPADSPPLPPMVRPAIMMALLFVAKVTTEGIDGKEHRFSLRLIRPDGEVTDVGESAIFMVEKPKIPGTYSGVNVGIPQIGVLTKQEGLHYFIADIDGKEVARAPFILTEQQLETRQ